MKRLFCGALLALAGATLLPAQNPEGDWQGTLKAGAAELRLVLHVSRSGGGWKATIDSVDQAANGIPVSSISLEDFTVKFTVDAVHGSYEGRLAPDSKSINGTWTQNQALPLTFQRATAPLKTEHKPAKPTDIDGAWQGAIDAGGLRLRVIFHITNTEDGLTAKLDSPDQNARGIPATTVTRSGASLKIEMKQLGGVFEGKIDPGFMKIEGTWIQGGMSTPLTLTRVRSAAELERRRPQNPVKPYPYREEEVAYRNESAGIRLAATLTVPEGKGPSPAVVLITGSGPQDRDETLMGHRPFLVLADYLTRHGIAVLRADDRGVGKSGGTFANATMRDFATDTEAGIGYLKTRPEIDAHRIGLIGHSEGGVIAPMVAARNPDVAFIVMMAGTGVSGEQILIAQARAMAEFGGKSHEDAELAAKKEREILDIIRNEKDESVARKKLAEVEQGIEGSLAVLNSAAFREFIDYDPASALRKVKCPVLAIIGAKDSQVAAKQNLPAIRKALEDGGNPHFEVEELSGLNHLFQSAKTGSPAEYGDIEETMAPSALEKIADWIRKQTGLAR